MAERGTPEYQGMNWIRQDKRLAIYLRDGLACAWCGNGVENGAKLPLEGVAVILLVVSDDCTNVHDDALYHEPARSTNRLDSWPQTRTARPKFRRAALMP